LRHPLLRVGERGENKWKEVSWKEAYDTIETKLNDIKARHGPESVLFFYADGKDVSEWITILTYSYGSPNLVYALSGSSCYTPRTMVTWAVQGNVSVLDASQWLPKRYDDPAYKVPRCIIVWAQDPQATCADGFYSHWIVDLKKRGSELIVIDPRCTWLASRAKLWLQLRPATDGALALGMLNVIITEKLFDAQFVEKWTNAPFLVKTDENRLLLESDLVRNGSEKKFVIWDTKTGNPAIWNPSEAKLSPKTAEPALEGTYTLALKDGITTDCKTVWTLLRERVADYSPDKVADITWVPRDRIVDAARFYAKSHPSAIHWGASIDMITTTTPTAHAIALLWCITGNVDKPGTNVIALDPLDVNPYPLQPKVGASALTLPPDVTKKRIGADRYGPLRDFRPRAHTDLTLEQVFTEKPYPIKGMWIQGANILAGNGMDPRRWYEAMKKMEFIVCVDLFMNPTSMLADIVLPAATFLERDSLHTMWVPLNAIKKAITVAECKSDTEIDFELAKRFNPQLPWKSLDEMFDNIVKPSGMTFGELKKIGWKIPPRSHRSSPYRRHEKGKLRPDGQKGFNTLTGRIEIFSTIFRGWGIDPLPYYEEPPFSPIRTPEIYKDYPLIMMTGRRSSVYFLSEHRMIPWLREVEPDPVVEIHPDTAAAMDVKNGDSVWIENWLGRCKRKAKLTPIIHPKTIMVPHGWWFPEKEGSDPSLFGVWDVNVNQLIPMGYNGAAGYGSPIKSMLCKVYKAE
jgi:anaerobic selenocysteine-containing dehydrogenase